MRPRLFALLIAATSLAGCGDGIAPPESGRFYGELTGDFSSSLSGTAAAMVVNAVPSPLFALRLASDDEATTTVEITLRKFGRPGVGSYPVSPDGPFSGQVTVTADGASPVHFTLVSGTLTVRHSSTTAFSGTFSDFVADEANVDPPESREVSLRGSFTATCSTSC